MARRQKLAIN